MKRTKDGLISDSGHTFLCEHKGVVTVVQHSIAEGALTEEDVHMRVHKDGVWSKWYTKS